MFKDKSLIENRKREIKINGVYKHFKGNLYIVLDVARCSETGHELVIYRSLKDGKLWSRAKEMFMDIKQVEDLYTYRFSLYQF